MELVLGEHLGEAVGALDRLPPSCAVSWCFVSPKPLASRMFVPSPSFAGGLPGDGELIAGDHLDRHAHLAGGRDGRLGVVARRIEQRQHAEELPLALRRPPGPRRASGSRAPRTRRRPCSTAAFTCAGVGRQLEDHLRRALGDLELLAVRALDGGLGALVHRVERLEVDDLVALQRVRRPSGRRARPGRWCPCPPRARPARRQRMTSSAVTPSTQNGSPSVSLFWVSVPVLSEHSTSTPASSSIAASRVTIACFVRQQARADRHRHRQHGRHRHRDRGHGQHQRELQRGEHRVAAEERDGEDQRRPAPPRGRSGSRRS